ncbi:hypothetical protein D3C87_63050 [compost metagenome]
MRLGSINKNRGVFTKMTEDQQITPDPQTQTDDKALKRKKWLKRFGIAGFMFFLIKGLVWIAIALFAWKGCQ